MCLQQPLQPLQGTPRGACSAAGSSAHCSDPAPGVPWPRELQEPLAADAVFVGKASLSIRGGAREASRVQRVRRHRPCTPLTQRAVLPYGCTLGASPATPCPSPVCYILLYPSIQSPIHLIIHPSTHPSPYSLLSFRFSSIETRPRRTSASLVGVTGCQHSPKPRGAW